MKNWPIVLECVYNHLLCTYYVNLLPYHTCILHVVPHGEMTYINTIHPIALVGAQRIPISLWNLCGDFNTRRYTSVHSFYFFKLFPIECIGLMILDACKKLMEYMYLALPLFVAWCTTMLRGLGVQMKLLDHMKNDQSFLICQDKLSNQNNYLAVICVTATAR